MSDPIEQGFRLSPHQRRLWRLAQGEAVSPYRCRCALRLAGPVDRAALAGALADVAAAYEILRTAFPLLRRPRRYRPSGKAARPPSRSSKQPGLLRVRAAACCAPAF